MLTGCGGKTASDGTQDTAKDTAENVSKEEAKQVTLTFMDHTSEEAKIQWEDSVITNFEAEHPNVTIEVQRMSYDDYIQTLQTKFASGDAPDIYALENTYIPKYIENGYVAPLDGTEAVNAFQDGALDMLTVDGSTYAIPYSASVMSVTYNKDVFEKYGIKEIPKTSDEFYAVCDQLKKAGVVPIGAAYSDTWCLMADLQADYISGVLLNNKNAIIDVQDRKQKFADSEEWRGVLNRIKERLQYANEDPFGTDWDTVCTQMANGEIAMVLNGNWTPNNVLDKNENVNLGTFALPTTNDASKTVFAVQSPTEGLALNAGSKNLEVGKEFLDYYTSKTSSEAFVKTNNEICVIKDVDTSNAKGALADVMAAIGNGGAVSLGAVDHNFTNEYRDALQTVVSAYLLNDMSTDEALTELDKEFDRIAGK